MSQTFNSKLKSFASTTTNINGSIYAVSIPTLEGGPNGAVGAVLIYTVIKDDTIYTNGKWNINPYYIWNPRNTKNSFGAAIKLSGDGNTIVISDPYVNILYVYRNVIDVIDNLNSWGIPYELTPPLSISNIQNFGTSVAMSFDGNIISTIAISSYNSVNLSIQFIPVVYNYNNGWTISLPYQASVVPYTQLQIDMSLKGETIVIFSSTSIYTYKQNITINVYNTNSPILSLSLAGDSIHLAYSDNSNIYLLLLIIQPLPTPSIWIIINTIACINASKINLNNNNTLLSVYQEDTYSNINLLYYTYNALGNGTWVPQNINTYSTSSLIIPISYSLIMTGDGLTVFYIDTSQKLYIYN